MKTALLSGLLLLTLVLTGGVLVLVYDVHQDLAAVHQVLGQASATTGQLTLAITKVSVTADTLNAAASEERKNWAATSQEAAYTGRALRMLISRVDRSFVDGTLQHINNQTLPGIDAQIAQNGAQMASTLKKAGETADGATAALEAIQPVMTQTQKDLATLNLVIEDTRPLLANSTATMANAARISGDLAKITDAATAPQPWYKKAWGYVWAPIKIGAVFLK
jgi:hypothetical protein